MHNSPVQKYCYVLLLLSFSLTSLSQTHRYVNPSGTDSGTCSEPGSPCQSIDYAITQAAANDVLNLTEGTFTATTLSTRVVLSGRGTGTVVQGITVNAAVSGTDPVSIENLTVTSSSTHGITIGTSYVELFNVNSSNHSGRNVNIDAATAIQNITISNCVLDGGDYGLWLTEQTDLTNLTVLNTSMDNNTIGFYSQLGNSASAGIRLAAVLVRNCTFNNNLRKGIYAEKLENAIFENITVDNSGTDATYDFNNGIDINLKWQAYSGITIRNSRVINSGAIGSNDIATAPDNRHTSAIAIKARTDAGSYNGTPASLTNVTLDGVIIDGLVTDLRFGEMGKTDNDGMDMSTV
ncbi:MAG: right-handed parallel beta-helix repeat-containing protein, partial [Cyclobacteriaceae bacterium]